jgi:LPXTG-site transpeptidase (sortase) family protein
MTNTANTIRLAHGGIASLVRSEIQADGSLPIPNGVREATWWGAQFTATTGATVFAGHVNWQGQIGPFNELWEAATGDQVTVVGANGNVMKYKVTQVLTLSKDELPAQANALFGQTGSHRIVLVTCGGEWVGGEKGYNDNRIVVAVPA